MIVDRLKKAGAYILPSLFAIAVLLPVLLLLNRCAPRHDPTPIVTARKDEKTIGSAARTIAADVERRNEAASINIDLTTKEIRDAFDALPAPQPPASTPGGDAVPRDLPDAPVERVRNRLNEGVARANRAAGAAEARD